MVEFGEPGLDRGPHEAREVTQQALTLHFGLEGEVSVAHRGGDGLVLGGGVEEGDEESEAECAGADPGCQPPFGRPATEAGDRDQGEDEEVRGLGERQKKRARHEQPQWDLLVGPYPRPQGHDQEESGGGEGIR